MNNFMNFNFELIFFHLLRYHASGIANVSVKTSVHWERNSTVLMPTQLIPLMETLPYKFFFIWWWCSRNEHAPLAYNLQSQIQDIIQYNCNIHIHIDLLNGDQTSKISIFLLLHAIRLFVFILSTTHHNIVQYT